jgi:predicted transcriptional regulator
VNPAVVTIPLSVEAFEELRHRASQRAVDEAERDLAEGHWVAHAEVIEKLKRWAQ